MRIAGALSVLLAVCAASVCGSFAHDGGWKALYSTSIEQRDQGNWGEAVQVAKEALGLARRNQSSPSLEKEKSYILLSDLYKHHGNVGEAIIYRKKALIEQAKRFGDQHPNVVSSRCALANLYEIQGDFHNAESLYGEAMEILASTGRSETLAASGPLIGLATVSRTKGKLDEAADLYGRALGILERHSQYRRVPGFPDGKMPRILGRSAPCSGPIQRSIDILPEGYRQMPAGKRLFERLRDTTHGSSRGHLLPMGKE